MAHVKCRYDHYSCDFAGDDCYNCNYSPKDYDVRCCHLECEEGYYEADSKSIDFDGKFLIVGKKFAAYDHDGEGRPTAGDNVIDYLEIDGREYINYEKLREDFENAKAELERESQEQGWQQVCTVRQI